MQIKAYKSLWGMEGTRDEQLERIARAGYDGVETAVPPEGAGELRRAIERQGLGLVALLATDDPSAASGQALRELGEGLLRARDAGAILANVHSGRDCWGFDEGCAFLEGALRAEERAGLRVGHETHRTRLLYAPWVAGAYLRRFPELRVTADFSHWVCVAERMLADQEEDLALACERTIHIHTRVGYEEGPQVPDPRAPEYEPYVAQHEAWWDRIHAAHLERGEPALTFDPEFGPPRYLQTLPYTQAPVADLWDICLYMTDRLRRRWA